MNKKSKEDSRVQDLVETQEKMKFSDIWKVSVSVPISCLRDQVENHKREITNLSEEERKVLIDFYARQIERNEQKMEEIKQEIIRIREKR